VVTGFGGQLDVLLARAVCRPRAGLVFAPLVSLSETLVEDRGVFPAGGVRARAVGAIDRATFAAADLVLADTAAHADYLVELGAARDRVAVLPLGVEPEFLAAPPPAPVPRRVLFYGHHLPLHGVETILAAAERLAGDVEVVLVGNGPERAALEARDGAAAPRSSGGTTCASRSCPASSRARPSCSACSAGGGRRPWWCPTRSGRPRRPAGRW
jgi:glycosyltransferase involved in cell wall biosynthesis